jgi:hypothetical protein
MPAKRPEECDLLSGRAGRWSVVNPTARGASPHSSLYYREPLTEVWNSQATDRIAQSVQRILPSSAQDSGNDGRGFSRPEDDFRYELG